VKRKHTIEADVLSYSPIQTSTWSTLRR